jgi:hypothetical protein
LARSERDLTLEREVVRIVIVDSLVKELVAVGGVDKTQL